ncbi:uncharacterized protein isoform X2 [Choristoneura fumiferana]|uniref:uncharacterized protein isoform X2 n=1 Tax=Choristoneura fumiferana TaxID=7141 RepID=UPI003D15C1A4
MPPKKNVSKTAVTPKIPKEKAAKPRIRKEKPKLKTPSVVKVKLSIPVKPATKKEMMMDRINEVARAQLVKDSPVNIETVIPEKKKRGRKKKIKPETVPEVSAHENTNDEVVVKKKRAWKKRIQPEPDTVPDDSGEVISTNKPTEPPKETSTSNGLLKKSKVQKNSRKNQSSTKPVLSRQNKISKVNKTVRKSTRGKPNNEEITSPIILNQAEDEAIKSNAELDSATESNAVCSPVLCKDKKSPVIKRTVKRKYVRRKTVIDEDSTITSPSILSQGLLEKTHDKELRKMTSESNNNADSRRTSVTSASEWSWTKDISGSSTTTCITVASTDFIRLDGKLPIVKLNHCDALIPSINNSVVEKKTDEHSLSEESSSSSSSSSSDSSSSTKVTVDNFLNLSTSSVSPAKLTPCSSVSYHCNNEAAKQLTTLEKLSLALKKFNLGFHAWNEKDEQLLTQMETYEKTIFKVMSEEHSVLLECDFLTQILSNKCVVSEKIGDTAEAAGSKETDFVKPSAGVITNKMGHEGPKRRDSMALDLNDDDDALSLFAESITGFDSSRASSNASLPPDIPPHEEYVPQPIRDAWAPVERTYQPSKIDDTPSNTKKLVCEKQNADSTSLYKEPEIVVPNISENVVENSLVVENEVEQSGGVTWDQQQQLTISTFTAQSATRNITLRGVCFFNLISNCKKLRCKFPHRALSQDEFNTRLSKLSEEQFIQEYLLIVKFSALRIKYMKCFVFECQRRELPKILVEMVIIFISKSNPFSNADLACKVDTIESALLYLNTVNLAVCEDRLKYGFSDGKYLCEVFMETIANTQNFWRFKPVFLALADFMVREQRAFTLEVAAHILERVCIFKFEEPLALVLLSIIELTDGKVFNNSMMGTFEKQLQSFSAELYERFLAAKDRSVLGGQHESPARSSLALSQEAEPPSSIVHSDPENRYTSPDTTNLDNLNKPIVEPIITRTINLDKIRSLTSSTPQSSFQKPQHNWDHRNTYNKIPRFTPPMQMRPRYPLKRPMGRQVLYGPRPCKYPRRSGPDFYGNQ